MDVRYLLEHVELGFELVGVAFLVVGSAVALVRLALSFQRKQAGAAAYRELRVGVGRSIMVGLEFLVAADIIRSVALEPTLQSVGILGLIVVVRTLLSWSIEVEISGEWPWHRRAHAVTKGDVEDLADL